VSRKTILTQNVVNTCLDLPVNATGLSCCFHKGVPKGQSDKTTNTQIHQQCTPLSLLTDCRSADGRGVFETTLKNQTKIQFNYFLKCLKSDKSVKNLIYFYDFSLQMMTIREKKYLTWPERACTVKTFCCSNFIPWSVFLYSLPIKKMKISF